MGGGKWVCHGCGYRLWSFVLGVIGGQVVVNYRDGGRDVPGLVVACCPGCGGSLRLWWDDPTGQVVAAEERRLQQMVDEAVGGG